MPAALLVVLVAARALAQRRPSAWATSSPDCAQSGQPATAAFDASQIEFVADPAPALHENQTIRFSVIARVLQPAPLILDVLDSRMQTLYFPIMRLRRFDPNYIEDGILSRTCGSA